MTTPDISAKILREAVPVFPTGNVWGVRTTIPRWRARHRWRRHDLGLLFHDGGRGGNGYSRTPVQQSGGRHRSVCVAPFIAPRGGVHRRIFRQRHVFFGGLVEQLIGLLVISVSVASIITAVLHRATGIIITPRSC